MKFNYQARTKTGEIQAGIIDASSREGAVSILQKYGLYITALEEAEDVPFYARKIKLFENVSQKDKVLFSRQLSIMFSARVPLVESLRTLVNQTNNPYFREKISGIADDVEAGTALSLAISKHPETFSPFYVAMVKAGESSGKLSGSLEYLAEHLEKEYYLINRIKGAMTYPALVFFFALIVLVLMLFFIIPQLTEVLEQTGGEMPTITKMIIIFTKFLKEWALFFILIFILLAISIFIFYKSKAGKESFDKFFLKIPFIGNYLKMVYISQFAENLSTLISGGLPIAQCLELAGRVVGNSVYQEIIFQTRDEVRKGRQISSALARFPEAFPPVFTQMALVGEKSGTLDKTLMHLVTFYGKEVERNTESLLGLLEPLLIIFLGVVVGGLIAAFLIPLYQQMATFGG